MKHQIFRYQFAFNMLYERLVRSHLKYVFSLWHSYGKGFINEIEKVQRQSTN